MLEPGEESRILTRTRQILFACLYGYAGFAATSSVWWPMGRDQGVFAWIGDVIVRGGTPYRDAWDVKGPAVHYTYALVQWMLGRTMWGIRAFDLLFLAIAGVALWRLLKRFGGGLAANVGTPLFVFLYLRQGYWSTAQADGWATMTLVFAIYLVLAPGRGPRLRWIAAGALVGLAALFKSTYLAFLLPFVVIAVAERHDTLRAAVGSMAMVTASCIVVIGLSLVWLALHGALRDFLEIQLQFNVAVHRGVHGRSLLRHVSAIGEFISSPCVLAQVPFFSLGIVRVWRAPRPFAAGLLAFLVVALGVVVLQDKYYRYHWTPMYAALAVFTALGVTEFDRLFGKEGAGASVTRLLAKGWILLMIVFIMTAARPLLYRSAWSTFVLGQTSRESYYARFGTYATGDFSFLAEKQTADYLERRTDPGDLVLVWGVDPLVNYLCGRASPSRFGHHYALIVGDGTRFHERYRREFMRDIVARKPEYIVIVDEDTTNLRPKTSQQYFEEFEEFSSFVWDEYVRETSIEHFELWRRAPSPY